MIGIEDIDSIQYGRVAQLPEEASQLEIGKLIKVNSPLHDDITLASASQTVAPPVW